MYDNLTLAIDARWEPLLVLAVGTTLIVGLSTLAGRFVRSAVWQRTLWQVAALGLLALAAMEITGLGSALVRLSGEKLVGAVSRPPACAIEVGTEAVRAVVGPDRPGEMRVGTARMATLTDVASDGTARGETSRVQTTEPNASFDTVAAGDFGPLVAGSVGDWAAVPVESMPTKSASNSLRNATLRDRQATGIAGVEPLSGAGPRAGTDWGWWLGWVWMLGAAVLAGRLAWSGVLLAVFRRRMESAGAAERGCVKELARRVGIGRPVCVLQTVGLRTPVAFGWFSPTIALPASWSDQFDRRQQEAMLAHELAHLAAGDPAWQLLANLLCVLAWWHPLAWYLRHRLRAAGEAAADEASLLVPDGPGVLAACLVAMGRRLVGPPRLGWLSIEGPGFRSGLGRRVERLLSLPAQPRRAPGRGRLLLARIVLPVALMLVVVSCTAWARPQAHLSEGEMTMNVFTVSWRRSLAAAALLALWSPIGADAVAEDAPAGETKAVATADAQPLPDAPAVADGDKKEAKEGRNEEAKKDEVKKEEGRREGQPRAEAREGERKEGGDRPREEAREGERREGGDRPREAGREQRREPQADRPREAGREQRREPQADRPREPGERPILEERIRRAVAELEQQARNIHAKLESLPKDAEADRAALQAELRKTEERIREVRQQAGRGPQEGPPRPDGPQSREIAEQQERLIQHRRGLEERMMQIRRAQEGLKDGQDAEARELQANLDKTKTEMSALEEQLHRLGRGPEQGPAPPQMQRLEEIRRQIEQLSQAGRHDEAERLKVEGRELMQAMHRGEIERRMQQVREAAEKLRAAGRPDEAERLIQEAERKMAEMREGGPRPPEPPRPDGERREGPAIEELRGQIGQLRGEMQEIRGQLKRLLERQERQER